MNSSVTKSVLVKSHFSSLKEAINTGQKDLMLKISALILLKAHWTPIAVILCIKYSAVISDVPWSCALYVTNSCESAKHWNLPLVIVVFVSILHWHCSINNDIMWEMISWDFSEGLSF